LHTSSNWLRFFTVLTLLALTACGFQLRGVANLSFKTLYIEGAKLSISRELKQSLKNNDIKIVETLESAEVVMELMSESNQKRILSLGGTGKVSEYELNYEVNFRMREASNPLWNKVQSVKVRRDFSYDDQLSLGKAEEEARINNDMRSDAVREIVRRLSAFKTGSKAAKEPTE
jgi:LPS-assembly lipoprotein